MMIFKNRFVSLLTTALLCLSTSVVFGQTRADSLRHVFFEEPDRVLVVSPRGNHIRTYPENSLPAYQEAIEAGAGVVELDLRQSKDGHLIVMHDETVDRTTDGKGKVSDLTLAELKDLRLLQGGKPSALRIPTFEEALEAVKGEILVDIDFKIETEEAAKACYQVIEKVGMEEQVLFFLYDVEWVSRCLALNPEIMVMPRAYDEET